MKRVLVVTGMTFLAACTAPDAGPPAPVVPVVDPSSPLAAPTYMQMAASSDLFEIQSGQLAAQMSQNAAVRGFGNLLVAHHTHTSQTMMSAAQAAGLTPPPPALLPPHQAMLDQLRAAGPNFDVAFKTIQIQAHQEALALHQNYANGGDHPALRTVAGAAVPVVQQHLTGAQALPTAAPPPLMPVAPQAGERG